MSGVRSGEYGSAETNSFREGLIYGRVIRVELGVRSSPWSFTHRLSVRDTENPLLLFTLSTIL
jgi:hypothetical protein